MTLQHPPTHPETTVITPSNTGTSAREGKQLIMGERALPELVLHADWRPLHESEHVVQFYEADTFLLKELSAFISAGLAAGDACIVIATPAHRAALNERLQAAGLDVVAADASGQYVALDAAETLARFMVDGSPDPGRFTAVIGPIIARATAGRPHVRIFGEMVALLWAAGQYAAALHLEALWNELHTSQTFVLFCAYPIHGFRGEALARPLHNVCAAHTRVIPAESYTRLADPDDRLHAIIQLQQQAQSLQTEIAARKATEEQLRRREQELTDFFEHAPVALHWIGPDGSILWANQAELALLGYTQEEYFGHHIAEFHADPDVIHDILARLGRGEELHNYEARLRCKDGSIRYVLISSNVHWEDGRFIHTRCFTQDITERKQADKRVQFQAQLLDNVEQAVIAADNMGIITYWNCFAEKLYGWTAAEAIGKHILDVVIPEVSQQQADQILAHLQSGTSWSGEYAMRRRDGGSFPAFVNDAPIRDESGKLAGIVGVSVDISARKQTEAELHHALAEVHSARDQLQALSRRLLDVQEAERRMIARELHDEIGQDLTGLILRLLMIDPHDPAEVIRTHVQEARQQVNHIMAQVRQMSLDLRPPMLDDLGLLPALQWHIKRYTEQTHIQVVLKHAYLEQRFAPEVEITAYRVVQEALTNVARHASVDTATVQVRVDDGRLHVQIKDHGRGFDTASKMYTSSGLSGMRERVRLLQGTVAITSALGKGTCVQAMLPLNTTPERQEESNGRALDRAGR